jgi:limonene 1,2-monooxygenase
MVTAGERRETVTYLEETLGRPPGRSDHPLRDGVRIGTTFVGTPENGIADFERLVEKSQGGPVVALLDLFAA